MVRNPASALKIPQDQAKHSALDSLKAKTAASPSLTTSPTPAPKTEPNSVWIPCIITSFVTLLGIVIKDLVLKKLEEGRAENRSLAELYSRYAEPLASSAQDLLWRLNEVCGSTGRASFLRQAETSMGSDARNYAEYKKVSTLYRVAAILAWVRACEREFAYLKIADPESAGPIRKAIDELKATLADGEHVEIDRVKNLCSLWGLSHTGTPEQLSALAIDLESRVTGISAVTAKARSEADIVLEFREYLKSCPCITHPDLEFSLEVDTAMKILLPKQAWIYRDWQRAIGDLMIRPALDGIRRFEVIGFGEFENLASGADPQFSKWIVRLSGVFDNLDMHSPVSGDYRPDQIRRVQGATARLILALKSNTAVIGDKTIRLAEHLSQS